MRGKKITQEEFKQKVLDLLGPDYIILNEYNGSNSYIELYHQKCNSTFRVRANHIVPGFSCKCEKINNFVKYKEKVKQTNLKRYGVEYPLQSNKVKEKLKQTNLTKYGVENVYQNKDIRAKCVVSAKSSLSTIDNTKFDSSYERDVYDFCKRNNIEIQDRQVPIHFNYNNKEHVTFIDFKIDGYLFECKGSHLLNGIFDYALEVPIDVKLDIYKQNHVIVITNYKDLFPKPESLESNGLKYLNKCPNPLIGVDIDLFRQPQFPFRTDRPECFYKVKVDNSISSLEAWGDELLRWKMIKNRIDYVGRLYR